jgi:NAD(P)-dependent dehydrogenase (short-subunit alcohol dehydrogenase family)
MTDFEGRQILVTGGAGDLGAASARALADRGARIILAGPNRQKGEEIAETMGAGTCFLTLDVTNEENWTAALTAVLATGPLYGLINAAGIFRPGIPFADMTLETWREHFAVNLDGSFLGCRLGIAAMKDSGGGTIVNFSSGLAHVLIPGTSAYSASKLAVIGLTRIAALEGAPHQVRVNAIMPGAIDTAMMWRNINDNLSREDLMALALSQHPIGRIGHPTDIAHAMAFLCEPASGFITGAILSVDGGQLLT